MNARTLNFFIPSALLFATVMVAVGSAPSMAQVQPNDGTRIPNGSQVPHHAGLNPANGAVLRERSVCPPGHPLREPLNFAYQAWEQMASIRNYTCRFVKRERIEEKLLPHEFMFLKVRHEPFSVYLYSMGPSRPRADEAIYIEGRNNGMVLAHTTGIRDRIAGTVELKPTSPRLMNDNIYPLTNIGIQNLLRKMIGFFEYESHYGECEVEIYPEVKVDGRSCSCVQVVHPVPRRNFKFHLVRSYFDDEYKIPIRFEAYSWPQQPGGPPVLIEEYSYLGLKLNQHLTDEDFDVTNPRYGFR